jgi:hypothetical protein
MLPSFKTREELLELLPKNIICAELGVFQGTFSEIIFNTLNPSLFYMVDIFEGIMGSGDKNGNNMAYIDLSESYNLLKEKYVHKNVKVVKSTTVNFLNSLEDNYLDFVYIDAQHTYEDVSLELQLADKKVKKQGFITGHDYHESAYPGVVRAVAEFCHNNKYKLSLTTDDIYKSFLITRE